MKRLIFFLLCCLVSGPVFAESPIVKFPGKLVADNGSPVGGIFFLRFSLHLSQKAPEDIWFEEMYVAVNNGTYLVQLGANKPLPSDTDLTQTFLQVTLDGLSISRVPVDPTWLQVDNPSQMQMGVCRLCDRAETAGTAQRLDGLNLRQLKKVIVEDLKPGEAVRLSSAVGGSAGASFKIECPPGFVATGLQGSADATINNISLICRPLASE